MKRDALRYSKNGHKFYVDVINYGSENFKLEILEECDRINLLEREQFWYDELQPFYNMIRPTECNFLNEEVKKKAISRSQTSEKVKERKEKYNTEKYVNIFRNCQSYKMKNVDMFTLEDVFIKSFISIQEASRYITETTDFKGVNKTSKIKAVCDGERITAYGFKWKYSKV